MRLVLILGQRTYVYDLVLGAKRASTKVTMPQVQQIAFFRAGGHADQPEADASQRQTLANPEQSVFVYTTG